MNEQIRNINPLDYINLKIDLHSKSYGKVKIRAALFREKESTHLCIADVNFSYKTDSIPKDVIHDCGSIVLTE